jgi:hypothetical protein
MTEDENKNPKRVWPWLLLAGVILWIAVSVFWVWREVQRIKRQKITVLELPTRFAGEFGPLATFTWQGAHPITAGATGAGINDSHQGNREQGAAAPSPNSPAVPRVESR